MKTILSSVALLLLTHAASLAHAESHEYEYAPAAQHALGSPETFNLEFRGGPYTPDTNNNSFDAVFGSDSGLLWAAELDGFILSIPFLGKLGVGASFGWAEYEARAFVSENGGERAGEKTTLTIFPLSGLGVIYVDVLARELDIPLVFLGKLGMDAIIWRTETGSTKDGDGISLGLRWATQAALELDVFEPSAARMLDEEWGINHARIFGEIFGSTAGMQGQSLALGDITFAAGLGFTF